MVRLHPNRHDFLDIRLANGFGQSSGGLANFSSSSAPVPPLHLTSKEDSTRVQLQKQKLREQHQHAIIVAQTQKIPGVKTTGGTHESPHGVTRPGSMSNIDVYSLLCISKNESAVERFASSESHVHPTVYARLDWNSTSPFTTCDAGSISLGAQ